MISTEQRIKNTFKILLKDSQTILGISYVIAIGIGMLFTYKKYSTFDINIFDYSSMFDFLVSPFSNFTILLFTVISLVGTYSLFVFDSFYQNWFPKSYSKANFGLDRKSLYRSVRYFSSALLFFLYHFISASSYG